MSSNVTGVEFSHCSNHGNRPIQRMVAIVVIRNRTTSAVVGERNQHRRRIPGGIELGDERANSRVEGPCSSLILSWHPPVFVPRTIRVRPVHEYKTTTLGPEGWFRGLENIERAHTLEMHLAHADVSSDALGQGRVQAGYWMHKSRCRISGIG
jgi:hypothetical protein